MTTENSQKRPLLYDEIAAKTALDFWRQKACFRNPDYMEFTLDTAGSIFGDPKLYFTIISGAFGMEYYSRYSSPDGDLAWTGYDRIDDRDKYFSNCICNYVIQDFFESGFVLDVGEFTNQLEKFLIENNRLGAFCFHDIMECIKLYLGSEKFLESRGVFIETRPLGKRFSASADPEEVGEMCAQARMKTGLSKVAVAAASGMQEKSIRQLEKGEQNATLRTLKRFADSVGYDVKIEFVPKGNE